MNYKVYFGKQPATREFLRVGGVLKDLFAEEFYSKRDVVSGDGMTLDATHLERVEKIRNSLPDSSEKRALINVLTEIQRMGSVDMWFEDKEGDFGLVRLGP